MVSSVIFQIVSIIPASNVKQVGRSSARIYRIELIVMAAIWISVIPTTTATAQSWGGLYNMDSFLEQPHPFSISPKPYPPSKITLNQITSQSVRRSSPLPLDEKKNTPPNSNDPLALRGWSWQDLLTEVRFGALAHDTGPFSAKEEKGVDTNIEILLETRDLLNIIWSPRPYLGVSVNSGDDTNQAYAGLYWEWDFWKHWFFGLGLGGMIHDGRLVGDKDGQKRKSLGCRLLFREHINFGYRIDKHHSIMTHLDHSSNASLCEKNTRDGSALGRHDVILNEGLESIGIRYGYSF
ncbi:MAG: hypothetical protein CBB68_07400 [Rhodospirillaceae bacterium TMED8]|nr:hypothetical protein [Magnetovibrio sp.]OUT50811.1 MAG: hypothetical protein CBB68_07400 [Rhodospirillaceae bacterium TMED8]